MAVGVGLSTVVGVGLGAVVGVGLNAVVGVGLGAVVGVGVALGAAVGVGLNAVVRQLRERGARLGQRRQRGALQPCALGFVVLVGIIALQRALPIVVGGALRRGLRARGPHGRASAFDFYSAVCLCIVLRMDTRPYVWWCETGRGRRRRG
jgi:hypothetical protein